MYSTLAEFKTYLGIADSSQDAELTFYLNSANELLNKLLNVDSFDEATIEEKVKHINQECNGNISFILKNRPVQEVKEIGGDEVSSNDYMVAYDRKIIFKGSSILNKVDDFGFLTVKYKYGYASASIPSDLKLMEMMLASGFYQAKGYEGVSSYKLGDESITFGKINGVSADDIYFSFKTLYNKRKSFILPC